MTSQDIPVEETAPLAYDPDNEEWFEEPEELPRRPRRKLLSPVPATLLVVLLVAGAFFGGIEVEKGQGSSSTSSGLPSGFAALRASGAARALRSAAGGSGGFPGGGGFAGAGGLAGGGGGGLTSGEVSFVSGDTLYVSSGESTVKVSVPAGTKVSKTVSTSVHSIHPGDNVIVRGTQSSNGRVTASSVSISSAASGGGANSSSGSSGSGGAGAQQLFGSG